MSWLDGSTLIEKSLKEPEVRFWEVASNNSFTLKEFLPSRETTDGLPIYVDAYSGYKANERPCRFELDEELCEIAAVEDRWQSPRGIFSKSEQPMGRYTSSRTTGTKSVGR